MGDTSSFQRRRGRSRAVERNTVFDGSAGQDEIADFLEDLQDCKPESGVEWLEDYLAEVKTVYAFQHLQGAEMVDGGNALHALRSALWERGDAIIQADGEGFTNEEGFHIVWQFSDSVSGPWNMGVLARWRLASLHHGPGRPRSSRGLHEWRSPARSVGYSGLAARAGYSGDQRIGVYALRCLGVYWIRRRLCPLPPPAGTSSSPRKSTPACASSWPRAGGGKKGDLSRFVEEAVKKHIFETTPQSRSRERTPT